MTAAKTYFFVVVRYSPSVRADIGRYASRHGVAAAARVFSRKLNHTINTSTILSIKKAYLEKNRTVEDSGDLSELPTKKWGRRVLLGDDLDRKVQLYLKKVRGGGGVVSARIAVAAARGIVLTCDRSMLVEFGGHVELNRHWAYSLLHRMNFVQRKVTTAKSKYAITDFDRVKTEFLEDVVATVEMEEIPPELILNWDQTGIRIVPSNSWTMDQQGVRRVEIGGASDKRLITVMFCGSLVGDFLPIQVIYQGKTARCHPRFEFPPVWDITHSPKHWSNETTMIQYIEKIIVPYVNSVRESIGTDTPAVIIMDNFKGQVTTAVNSLLEANSIHVCLPLPTPLTASNPWTSLSTSLPKTF